MTTGVRNAPAYDAADAKADEIFAELHRRGLPVKFASGVEGGRKVSVTFQLDHGRAKYACRLPLEDATADRFEDYYRAVE